MKGLKLTPRGEMVRDLGTVVLGILTMYGFVLSMVVIGDGLGL